MQNIVLGARLRSALSYIPHGSRVADIGTDHAYLPIYLIQNGLASHALASDVNQGPLAVARANIEAAGLSDRIDTMLTDGLRGVESFSPDTVLIFGMGGELIVRILEEAPWIRDPRVKLILQPMSRVAVLREWLLRNQFAITGESITFEDKYYQTVVATFCGTCEEYGEEELAVGRLNIQSRPPLFEELVRHEIRVLERIVRGKSRSENADIAAEMELKDKLERLL